MMVMVHAVSDAVVACTKSCQTDSVEFVQKLWGDPCHACVLWGKRGYPYASARRLGTQGFFDRSDKETQEETRKVNEEQEGAFSLFYHQKKTSRLLTENAFRIPYTHRILVCP